MDDGHCSATIDPSDMFATESLAMLNLQVKEAGAAADGQNKIRGRPGVVVWIEEWWRGLTR